MMCKDCTTAADLRSAEDDPNSEEAIDRAIKGHAKCRGGTWCDCQHRVRKLNNVPTVGS